MVLSKIGVCVCLYLLLIGCGPEVESQIKQNYSDDLGESGKKLRVAAAANLRFVLVDLENDFERHSDIDLEIIFASSGKLTSQIINGAPYDIFLSANMKFPLKLVKENLTTGEPIVYALGALVMWSNKNLDLSKGLNRLVEDDIEKIAIASDKNAPYGSAALEALKKKGIYAEIEPKLIFGESVSQVNQYVKSESVDVGLTNKSVIFHKMEDIGIWKDVDTSLYSKIEQGIVITKYGEQQGDDCRTFLNYLFSPSAQKIFSKYGYLAP